jgi:hypothetical protein
MVRIGVGGGGGMKRELGMKGLGRRFKCKCDTRKGAVSSDWVI